jgi:hypothetical protein
METGAERLTASGEKEGAFLRLETAAHPYSGRHEGWVVCIFATRETPKYFHDSFM